jgi:hypothetical protein
MGLFKPKVSAKAQNAKHSETRSAKYCAVEIRCTDDACGAAKAERGKRYLSKEAPTFPLSECDRRDRCDCRYRHHEDRRGKGDRRGAGPLTLGQRTDVERRGKVGRRAEDVLDDPTVTEAQVSLDDTYYDYLRR